MKVCERCEQEKNNIQKWPPERFYDKISAFVEILEIT